SVTSLIPSGNDPDSQDTPSSEGRTRAIIAGVVGGTVSLIIMVLLIMLCRRSSISFQRHMINRGRHQNFGITALPLPDWPLFIPIRIHEKPPQTVGQNPPAETSLSLVGMREQKEQIPEDRAGTEAVETPQPDEQTYLNSTETGREQPMEQTQGPEILAQLSIVVQRLAHIEARLGEEPPPDYSSNHS
ncbi:hypothetical protein V5O48_016232, partial [Marasmius crinis-equi]